MLGTSRGYNPLAKGSLELADKHNYAKRCKKISFNYDPNEEDEENYCKCCSMPI